MARSGINKALVANARESLIRKGLNPSIDAVRVELGNTGSKTTISRYLQELEREVSTQIDSPTALHQPIQDLIARLARELHEGAQVTIEKNTERYSKRIERAGDRIEELETQLSVLSDKYDSSKAAFEKAALALDTQARRLQEMEKGQEIATLTETNLLFQLKEKQAQLNSLEDKYQHSRSSLEHYRQSMKDQRDQDHRRHEGQIQQLQSENRTLNQTLSVKQSDITQLNNDNARIVAELGAAKKQLREKEHLIVTLSDKAEDLEKNTFTLNAQLEDAVRIQNETAHALDDIKNQMDLERRESLSVKNELITVKTELKVKTDLFNTFQPRV